MVILTCSIRSLNGSFFYTRRFRPKIKLPMPYVGHGE
jgi:hypothetical protein